MKLVCRRRLPADPPRCPMPSSAPTSVCSPSWRSACASSADRTLCPCTSRSLASLCAIKNVRRVASSVRRRSVASPISRRVGHPFSLCRTSAFSLASASASAISAARLMSSVTCLALGLLVGTGCRSCLATADSFGSASSAAAPTPSGRSVAPRSFATSPIAPAATSGQHSSTMSTPSPKHS